MIEEKEREMGEEMTEAWAFIIANADTIERFCGRVANADPWLREEDFHSEVVAELAFKFDSWDQERSPTGSSWIWWQIKKVRLRIARKMSKTPMPFGDGSGNERDSRGRPIEAPPNKIDRATRSGMPQFGNISGMGPLDAFQTAQLKEALDSATDGQLDAAMIVAEGLSGDEVKARYGVTRQSALNRMGRLKAKLDE